MPNQRGSPELNSNFIRLAAYTHHTAITYMKINVTLASNKLVRRYHNVAKRIIDHIAADKLHSHQEKKQL